MSFRIGETVRSGNATARVKSYNKVTGFLVLMNIEGDIRAGSTVVGDDSNFIKTFSSFTISNEYDLGFADTSWDNTENNIVLDDGAFVAIDRHFDGSPSQDYQTTYMVTL